MMILMIFHRIKQKEITILYCVFITHTHTHTHTLPSGHSEILIFFFVCPMKNDIAIGGVGRKRKRKREDRAPSDPTRTQRCKENEKETIVLDATDLLPLEIWCHIVWRVPDASTFLAFARTCRAFAHIGSILQSNT